MKRVIIIGCGFAGAGAVRKFSRYRQKAEVIVFDRKRHFDFLPMLPDVIGRKINPEYLSCSIEKLSSKVSFNFINAEVTSLNIEKNRLISSAGDFDYDYLIIATGSQTNFYGNKEIEKYAYKLDNVEDTLKISAALKKDVFDNYVICGGGYTGVEAAANLRLYLNKNRKTGRIIIVERASSILGPLPQWMKAYTFNNLRKLEIEILTGVTVEKCEEKEIYMSGSNVFNNAMLIWCAGVKVPDFIQSIEAEKNPQGRLKTDEYLRVRNNVFAAGDAAFFPYKNSFLRMAVQFSIAQAQTAACNVLNDMEGRSLRKYKPVDLGYIIPMANNKSCGRVVGINFKGIPATFLHYFMCIYRSYGLKNKMGILRNLIKHQTVNLKTDY
ncbi:MAG: FAD-dependent oxidoreductase [Candidatus Omnitrophota bacterium]